MLSILLAQKKLMKIPINEVKKSQPEIMKIPAGSILGVKKARVAASLTKHNGAGERT